MQTASGCSVLPADVSGALRVGRVWRDGHANGPCVVVVRGCQRFVGLVMAGRRLKAGRIKSRAGISRGTA